MLSSRFQQIQVEYRTLIKLGLFFIKITQFQLKNWINVFIVSFHDSNETYLHESSKISLFLNQWTIIILKQKLIFDRIGLLKIEIDDFLQKNIIMQKNLKLISN